MQDKRGSALLLVGVGKDFTTGRSRKGVLTRGYGKVVLSRGLACRRYSGARQILFHWDGTKPVPEDEERIKKKWVHFGEKISRLL